MNEKASPNGGGNDAIPRADPEFPGLPEGEELVVDPVGGDEIDPIAKWWEEIESPEREKVSNRKLEDLDEAELPRRRKLPPSLAAELASVPSVAEAKEGDAGANRREDETAEQAPVAGGAGASSAGGPPPFPDEEVPLTEKKPDMEFPDFVPHVETKADPADEEEEQEEAPEPSVEDWALPEFEASPVKRGPRSEIPLDEGLAELFAELEKKPEPEEGSAEPERKPVEQEEIRVEQEEKSSEGSDSGSRVGKKPPPLPAKIAEEKEESPEEAESALEEKPAPEEKSAPDGGISPLPLGKEKTNAEEDPKVAEAVPAPSPMEDVKADGELAPLPVGKEKTKAGCWTVFATLFFLATVAVFALFAVAAFYAWTKLESLETEIAAVAREKLAAKGLHLDYGDWSYAFPRGLVFDEVTLYEDSSKTRPALKATGFGVNLDFIALVKNPASLGGAEFSLEDSVMTLFDEGEALAEITGLSGEVLVGSERVEVERLVGSLGGLRLNVGGVVTLEGKAAADPVDAAASDGDESAPPRGALDFSALRGLLPWLELKGAEGRDPLLSLSFAMDSASPDAATLEGSLTGDRVLWRDLEFASLAATFRVVPETGELSFPSVQIGYGDGIAGGSFSVDIAAQKLRIERLQSSVDLVGLLSAYRLDWAEVFRGLRCLDAPTLRVTGEVPLGEPSLANLKIRYEHRDGIVFLVGEKELPLRDLRGNFALNRGSIETNDAAAALFGGTIALNGSTNLFAETRPFNGLVEISAISLEDAAGFLGQEGKGLSGRLHLTFRGVGAAQVERIRGGGTLRIEEATLPEFPVVGPVRTLVGRVVPAFAAKGGGSVVGAFIVESGVLVTNDLAVAGEGARIVTAATVNLASQEVRFTSTAQLEPALAAATGLGDKAIVVEGEGPLEGPNLRLREFPVEFAAESLGEALGTTPETLGVLKELIGEDNTAEVVTGRIEEATGLKLDPVVTDLFRSLLGEDKPDAEAPRPILRATEQ